MSKLVDLTPMIPAVDVEAAATFYRDILGFRIGEVSPIYAFLKRDDVAIRIVQAADTAQSALVAERLAVYIDVDDADALYASLKGKLDTLGEGRVRSPFDQPYGMREFHVKDESGMLIFFGCEGEAG